MSRRCFAFSDLRLLTVAIAAVALIIPAKRADAQLRNSVSVLGGAFTDDNVGPDPHAYMTVRLGRDFSRFFGGELGFGYAAVSMREFGPAPTFEESRFRAPIVTADLAIHAMLPIRAFVPYVGVSGGVFRRFDSRNGINPGVEASGMSVGVLAGSKLHLGDLFGLRGEFRVRGDKYPGSRVLSPAAEYSLGMIFRF
jgi:hypothetical protein